ncbi:flagellar filament capping protein FliD [Photobacterium indicum]|uniref:flagellar filament capping protein FliD n=1 Tax=Photobacterium indicum TaxID=81447 RepID=UPI003D11D48D
MLMTGLGSGIDYESMIGAIIASERAPKDNQLNRQEGMNHAEKDALKEIQFTINSFRDTVENLNSSRELEKLKAALSNEDFLSVAVDANAVPGEYNFDVKNLAQAQRDQLFKVPSDSAFKSGTIEFVTGGKTVTVKIDELATTLSGEAATKKQEHRDSTLKTIAEQNNIDMTAAGWEADAEDILTNPLNAKYDQPRHESYDKQQLTYQDKIDRLDVAGGGAGVTLDELQSAINSHPDNDGVKATLVRTGNDISMVLNAKETGKDNGYTLNSAELSAVVLGTGTRSEGEASLQDPLDATVMFGSMELKSASNKMDNVIDGISLNLKAAGQVNVKVERDDSGVKDTIKTFVDSYNKIIETVNTYTKSSEDGAAALSGDSATRSMVSRMRAVIGDEYKASSYQTLSQLGITTTREGTLEVDQKKLDKAVEDDFEEVSKLFLGDEANPGMMDKMMVILDDYHKNGGTFDRRVDQLEYSNKQIAEDREKLDSRMEAKTLSLRAYYARMDSQIAQMNQTQSMLVSMLM